MRYFRSILTLTVLALLIVPRSGTQAAAGDLVKGSLSAVYYVTADGKRLAFPNEATYFSWYADFNAVKIVTDAELAALPLSGLVTIRPGVKIVKFETSPKVYAIAHNGTLRAFASEGVAATIYGADWATKVVVVPDAFLTSYKFGADITGSGQYWWSNESNASPDISDDLDPSKSPDAYVPVIPATPAPVQAPIATPAVSTGPTVKNVLFILWDPKRPSAAAPDKNALQRVVFGPSPSVADYYKIESNNQVQIVNAGILGWYSADYPPDHYWSDDPVDHMIDGFKTGAAERVSEALKKSDADFDFKKYDANNDGVLSSSELSIFIVIPQYGDPVEDSIGVDAGETPTTVPMVLDGVAISSVNELYVSTPLASTPEFGAITHGFARYVFGLSDIGSGNGAFSLMSDPHSDLFLDPFSRASLGWLTPKVVPKVQEISSQTVPANGSAIRIDRDQPNGPGLGSEYFLIENRERNIYDNDLPDTGLAVWDVSGSSPTLVRLNSTSPYNDEQALWHAQDDPLVNVAQELHWTDGARSGVRLLGLGAAGPVMNISLEKKILTVQDLVPLPAAIQNP
jgi:M6 family metalloprotease-like protein